MNTKQVIASISLLVVSATTLAAPLWWQAVLPSSIPDPANNPSSPEKVFLGQALYFDKRLSADGTIACASCHLPNQGGDDNVSTSPGVSGLQGTRNAQTVLNAGLMSAQFWEGREPTLEEQAKAPLINPVEHGLTSHASVVAIVQGVSGYTPLFDAAFGGSGQINIDNITKAIAAFERTLLTPNSPYEQFINGNTAAMTANQQTGMALFESLNCVQCHRDVLLARQGAPGQPFLQLFPKFPANADFIGFNASYDLTSDLGLAEVTGNTSDNNRFKVQSLLNIAETAPYFHNGSVADLDEAVRIMAAGQLNITLTQTQVDQLVDFLGTLTGDLPDPQPITVSDGSGPGIPALPAGFAVLLILAIPLLRALKR